MPPFAPPKTRALQTWTRFWQRYGGELPADLRVYNEKVSPATRGVITRIAKDGPVPKSLLGKLPPLAGTTAEASAGGGIGAGELAKRGGRKVVAIPAALGTLFGFVVFWALYHGWKITFGAIFDAIASVGIKYDKLFIHIDVHPFAFVGQFNRRVQNNLARDMRIMERAFVWCVNQFLEPIILIVGTILAIGYALWYLGRATEHAIAHRIPKTITQTIVRPVTKTVQKIETQTKTTTRVITKTIQRVETRVVYITKAALVTIKQVKLRLGRVETRLKRDEHRLTRLEKKVTAAGFVGIFGAVLAKTGLDWLRCRKVNRFGKNLCGMPTHWFNDLANLLADFLIIENICLVLPWLEAGVSEIAKPLVIAMTDVGAGLCHSKDGPAKPLAVPKLYLPAAVVSLTAGV